MSATRYDDLNAIVSTFKVLERKIYVHFFWRLTFYFCINNLRPIRLIWDTIIWARTNRSNPL